MYFRMKIIVAVFLILSVASIKSDHIEDDCREIHCPNPQFGCPTDSELKSSATEDDDEEEDIDSNPFDRLAAEGMIEEYFPDSDSMFESSTTHTIQKRSLQHRRREAIKIVPGDYRSFEPEYFKYHNHHQPHRKWKRDVAVAAQSHTEEVIQKCCPEFQCVCRDCPGVPKCKNGQVATMVEEGHGLPGSCCSKYECVAEIDCSITTAPGVSYWKNDCTKCDCIVGHELCQQLCEIKEDDSANNCFSEYLNRPILNGDSWLEDQDCKECTCINGDSRCIESYCKPVECENSIKEEGRCCRVCPPTTSTTTIPSTTTTPSTTPTSVNSTTEMPEISSTTDQPTIEDLPMSTTESSITDTTFNSTPPTTSGPEEDLDNTTVYEPTVIISTRKENLPLPLIITIVSAVGLFLVIICILATAKRNHKMKKLMYSTIPSSESSQSSSVTLA